MQYILGIHRIFPRNMLCDGIIITYSDFINTFAYDFPKNGGSSMDEKEGMKMLLAKVEKVFGREFLMKESFARTQVGWIFDEMLKHHNPEEITELQVEGVWEIMTGKYDDLAIEGFRHSY